MISIFPKSCGQSDVVLRDLMLAMSVLLEVLTRCGGEYGSMAVSCSSNHRRSMEHTCQTLISCIDQGVKYTVINVKKKNGRPYLLFSSYEINLLANSMQIRLGLHYETLLINFHRQTKG